MEDLGHRLAAETPPTPWDLYVQNYDEHLRDAVSSLDRALGSSTYWRKPIGRFDSPALISK